VCCHQQLSIIKKKVLATEILTPDDRDASTGCEHLGNRYAQIIVSMLKIVWVHSGTVRTSAWSRFMC
jgi:hypothetical protein